MSDIETGGPTPDRSHFSSLDTIRYIWTSLELPIAALDSLDLGDGDRGPYYQSSFKISHLAHSSIALSALSAALVHSLGRGRSSHCKGIVGNCEAESGRRVLRTGPGIPKVTVPLRHACLEFQTEKLFTINGKPLPSTWGPIGGLHKCLDGYVRIHDGFTNHRNGTLRLLGLQENASRDEVAMQVAKWRKRELEEAAHRNKLAIYALRSVGEWDVLPPAAAISNSPVSIRGISDDRCPAADRCQMADRCLRGLRVLELSRVIAGPVAGKTMALHGADVLWVTSPNLPDLPSLDRNLSRGKRSIQLDLDTDKDCHTLRELIKDCDVFIQGYRPQSLEARGFGPAELIKLRPGLIYASLSAFGPNGPWADRRGFDSLVQTCSGMNVSEAQHYGEGEPARPTPVQALDHAGGFLLATGISAALYRRAMEGGSWEVSVSLAGVMNYLRSLGQYSNHQGFSHADPVPMDGSLPDYYFEERDSDFGRMRGLKHAATVEGAQPRFDFMSRPLGSDEAKWLQYQKR